MFTVVQENQSGKAFGDLAMAMAYAQASSVPVVVEMDGMIIARVAPQEIKSIPDQIIEWAQDVLEDLHIIDVDVRLTKLSKMDALHRQASGGLHYLRIRLNADTLQYRYNEGYWDYEHVYNRMVRHIGFRPMGIQGARMDALHEIAHTCMQVEYPNWSEAHGDRWFLRFVELADKYLGWEGR